MKSGSSLVEHTARRSRLAGQHILDELGNPWFVPLDRLQSEALRHGRPLISFANYDYLGLSGHPAVKQAASEALDTIGLGALGSRLVGGERLIHTELEQAIARFVGVESCLTMVSGYLANLSVISHLMGMRDVILYDELSHNSIVSGVRGTKARAIAFRHNDMKHLAELLAEHRATHSNCLIIVEGLYSMDGDLPDLPELLTLKDEFGCWLMVDEAHSFGVLGATGRGISEMFGEDANRIDIIIGTLSKTLASCGGFICARAPVIDYLRFTLAGFVYSVGLPPVIAASALAALKVIEAEPQRVARLEFLSKHFLTRAREAGLETGSALGHAVVPVMFRDLPETMAASDHLLAQGIFAPPIVHVGVPKNAPRIRFFLSAAHAPEAIDQAIGLLRQFEDSLPAPQLASAAVR